MTVTIDCEPLAGVVHGSSNKRCEVVRRRAECNQLRAVVGGTRRETARHLCDYARLSVPKDASPSSLSPGQMRKGYIAAELDIATLLNRPPRRRTCPRLQGLEMNLQAFTTPAALRARSWSRGLREGRKTCEQGHGQRRPTFTAPPARKGVSVRLSVSAPNSPTTPPAGSGVDASGPDSTASPVYSCPTCGAMVKPLEKPSCGACGSRFAVRDGFLDMVPQGTPPPALGPARQSLFQNPLVSFAYERGWRRQFAQAGFPGPDRELDLMRDFFFGEEPPREQGEPIQTRPGELPETRKLNNVRGDAGVLTLDLSCGSGFMSRKMGSIPGFGRVIAVDLSAAMLIEAIGRAEDEGVSFDTVRADVARLPFADGSVDFVHAGAALHCWPKLQDGLAEVHRVLAPGGKFFATTFLRGAYLPRIVSQANLDERSMRVLRQIADRISSNQAYRFFEVDELTWLVKAAGFTDVSVEALNRCAVVRCSKE